MWVSSIRWLPASAASSRVTPGELDDILIANQGMASFEVGDDVRPSPRDQRQIHRRGLPVRLGLGLVEVGVAVDEQQPEAPSPPKGQRRPEEDRAVATEHEWEVAGVDHLAGRVGELQRVVAQGRRIEQTGGRDRDRIVRRGRHAAGVPRADQVGEPGIEECRRKAFDAPREQSEHRRSFDDRVVHGSHRRGPPTVAAGQSVLPFFALVTVLHHRPPDSVTKATTPGARCAVSDQLGQRIQQPQRGVGVVQLGTAAEHDALDARVARCGRRTGPADGPARTT